MTELFLILWALFVLWVMGKTIRFGIPDEESDKAGEEHPLERRPGNDE